MKDIGLIIHQFKGVNMFKKIIISLFILIFTTATLIADTGLGTSYVLDRNSSGLVVAYSLLKLKSTAVKSIRVRRDIDNAETDIGFNADGSMDTSSYSVFISTGIGYITTFYDQVGANDATQTDPAKQPTLTLNAVNGLPEINSVNGKILNSVNVGGGSGYGSYTIIMLARQSSATSQQYFWSKDGPGANTGDMGLLNLNTTPYDLRLHSVNSNSLSVVSNTNIANNVYRILTTIKKSTISYSLDLNGVRIINKTSGIASLEFNNNTLLMLGGVLTGTTLALTGGYNTFIMYDRALNPTEQRYLENEFKSRLNLT